MVGACTTREVETNVERLARSEAPKRSTKNFCNASLANVSTAVHGVDIVFRYTIEVTIIGINIK